MRSSDTSIKLMADDKPMHSRLEPPQVFSLKGAPSDFKIALLHELGFGSDGTKVLDAEGNAVKDPYLGVEIPLDRMVLMPGSTIILDDNPASIASYLAEHPERE
jgi:hypothetical protein